MSSSTSFYPLPFALSALDTQKLFSLFAVAAFVGFIAWISLPDPLADVPGPTLARWTPFWLAYHARKGKRYLAVHEAHKKYGPVVRIAPNHVSVATKDAPSVVYGQGSSAMDKSPFYRAFYVSGQPSMFSTQDRIMHAQKRRLLSSPFSYQAIRGFERFMATSITQFVGKLDSMCEKNGQPGPWIDALMWFNYLAFDIISDLAFGEPLGMVDQGSDLLPAERADGTIYEEHAASLIDQRGRTAAVVGLMPRFEFLAKMFPDPFISRGYQSTQSLSRIARRCIKRRLESDVRRDDILDRLIEGLKQRDDKPVTEEDIVTEAMLLLTAGSDTTANSITAIIHLICTHPDVYAKLMTELEQEVGQGLELPTHDEVKRCGYLQATIEEGLRVFATNAFGLPRIVPKGGAECAGRFFEEGTEISVPAWTIQNDPEIWGDPEHFRPERWLQDASELKKHLLTFGMGPRACIGKNLAYMQMQLVLATVLLRYEFELRDQEMESVEGFMHKPVELWVRLRRRGGSMPLALDVPAS